MRIVLIAGHGNDDPGAIGNGYEEQQLTRMMSLEIAKHIRQFCQVDIYDHKRNAFADCKNGVFNIGHADYVFEIHLNSFDNPNAYGTECFVTYSEENISVEQTVMNKLSEFFKLRNVDGVKRKNFLVINTCKSRGISSCLLETCFISNANDMSILMNNFETICMKIAYGILEGFHLFVPPTQDALWYEVNGADILNWLGKATGNHSGRIVEINGIEWPYSSIKMGDKLRLNDKADSPWYTVNGADILNWLGEFTGIDSRSIVEINKLPWPYNLTIGQKIRIK